MGQYLLKQILNLHSKRRTNMYSKLEFTITKYFDPSYLNIFEAERYLHFLESKINDFLDNPSILKRQ